MRLRWIIVVAVLLVVLALLVVVSRCRPNEGGVDKKVESPPPAPSSRDFPGPSNTGVPEGTRLSSYTKPCAITAPGTVIDAKEIQCGTLVIKAPNVTITNSRLSRVDLDDSSASVTIEDSEINGGTYPAPAAGFYNMTIRRVDARGGQTSILCGSNCLIEDSWLHSQMAPVADQHLGGYLSNGGSNVVLRHNTIECSSQDNAAGGGCTGDAQIFPDFGPLSNYTFENNLLKATPGGYCTSFGHNPERTHGNPTGIVVKDNVFERGSQGKCAIWGPATSFLATGERNVWSGNRWVDGEPIPAH